MLDEIVALIIETARDLGDDELELTGELTRDTQLFGDAGVLDSMGLVTLIVAVEQAVEDRFDKAVTLADEKALSQARSPYRSVLSLAEYTEQQIRSS